MKTTMTNGFWPLSIALLLSVVIHVAVFPVFTFNKNQSSTHYSTPKITNIDLITQPQPGQNKLLQNTNTSQQRSANQKNNPTKQETTYATTKPKQKLINTQISKHKINKVNTENKPGLAKKQTITKKKQLTKQTRKPKSGDTRPPLYGMGSPLNPKPDYPFRAQKYGYQGKVILQVTISKTGKVQQIKIKKSTGYKILDDTARQTISQWQFKPALLNGKAVIATEEIPVVFKLESH